ncbi:interleukin-31 receptor subunit alpha-like isoform X2 [Engraulis encrasicolus]|uniref:interleukin-31 receptor subunit alpha-like isoform X2 n=1 Tax=Engraulis encrasicolus TaxID=184585 RepID=UPI002FD21DF2
MARSALARSALLCLLCLSVTWSASGRDCLDPGKTTKEHAFHDPEMDTSPWHSTNISCISDLSLPGHFTCAWKSSHKSNDTYSITVTSKQKSGRIKTKSYETGDVSCVMHLPGMEDNVTVTVKSSSNKTWQINFTNMFTTVKYGRPQLSAEAYAEGIKAKWTVPDRAPSTLLTCELQDIQEPSNITRVVSNNVTCPPCSIHLNLTEVRPCATLAVRCHDRTQGAPWSNWSPAVKTSLPISVDLWRQVLKPDKNGHREVLLMWKGPPQACGVDEFHVFVDSELRKTLEASEEHTSVSLTAAAHEVTLALFKDGRLITDNASVLIPMLAEAAGPPVSSPTATVKHGQVVVSWSTPDSPRSAATSYVVMRRANQSHHMWQKTADTSISFYGSPRTLYTVMITPLYGRVPGNESFLYVYTEEGEPAQVSGVKVEDVDDRSARVEWDAVGPEQCCGRVLHYTVYYTTDDGSQQPTRNVTQTSMGNGERHSVTLTDLQPNTAYHIYVMASSIAGSSTSAQNNFKTRPFGKNFIVKLILIAVAALVALIVTLSIVICMKTLFNKLPNPRLSSLGKWSPQDPKKSASLWGVTQPSDGNMACDISTLEDILPHPSLSNSSVSVESQPFIKQQQQQQQESLQWEDNYESVPVKPPGTLPCTTTLDVTAAGSLSRPSGPEQPALQWTDDYESVPAVLANGSLSPPAGDVANGTAITNASRTDERLTPGGDGFDCKNVQPQDWEVFDTDLDESPLEHVESYITVETGQKLAPNPTLLNVGSSLENKLTGSEQKPGGQSTLLLNELSYLTVNQCRPNKVGL